MSVQKFKVIDGEDTPIGTIVYKLTKHDYGLARDDTDHTGIHHISVTLKPDGDYPSFTIPRDFLEEIN